MKWPRLLTPTKIVELLDRVHDQRAKSREQGGAVKAQIPAAYVSGNPTVQLPNESASSLGSKTHRIVMPFSNRTFPPTASQSVSVLFDGDRNRVINGVITDLSSYVIDSDLWMGVRPVTPGATSLDTAATERSTTSTTYVKVKEFDTSIPGRYRFTFRLSRSAGVASAIVRILQPDGITYLDASVAVTENAAAYPTFSATKTMDMTVTVMNRARISLWLKATSGSAYIDTAAILYANATVALVPYHATNID